MNRFLIRPAIALISLLALFVGSGVRADTRVSIDAVSPADGAELAIGASFHVQISYETDEPVSLWARPYFQGRQIEQIHSNASEKHTGSGQALGWFALTGPGHVDEVRILAGGGSPYRQWEVASRPVQLSWNAAGDAAQSDPQWVGQLQSEAAVRDAERIRQSASEPVRASDMALFSGFMLLVLALLIAGIAWPIRSVWKWRGGWRIAAAIPLALMGFVVLRIVFDTARDPTSHNLWPFEILMYGVVAVIIVAALTLARRVLGAQD